MKILNYIFDLDDNVGLAFPPYRLLLYLSLQPLLLAGLLSINYTWNTSCVTELTHIHHASVEYSNDMFGTVTTDLLVIGSAESPFSSAGTGPS